MQIMKTLCFTFLSFLLWTNGSWAQELALGENSPLTFSENLNSSPPLGTNPDVSLVEESNLINQDIAVRGKVSSEEGESLPGVNVLLKGTNSGTVTDLEGNYTLSVPNPNGVLVFSFI